MVVFLTSIRHPDNSNDFAAVEKLFEMALRSVCSQDHPDFRVVVTCNRRPQVGFDDCRICYHVVDFPPPSPERKAGIRAIDSHRDKGAKLLSGLFYARRFTPDYIAVFDADDLVSRRIVSYVESQPRCAGWYVDSGYLLNYSARRIQRKWNLVVHFGTSWVVSTADLLRFSQVADRLDEHSSIDEIVRQVDQKFLLYIIGDHKCVPRYFSDRGRPLRPLPFCASVWVQQTGQSHGENLPNHRRKPVQGVPISREFCHEFGLDPSFASHERPTVGESAKEWIACQRSWCASLRTRIVGFPQLESPSTYLPT